MRIIEDELPVLEKYSKGDKWHIAVNYVKLSFIFIVFVNFIIYCLDVGWMFDISESFDVTYYYMFYIDFCVVCAALIKSFFFPHKTTLEYNKLLS